VTATEAVKALQEAGITQPVLFSAEDSFWIKADVTPLSVLASSCFCDTVEFLVAFFCVQRQLSPPFASGVRPH